MIRLYSFSGLVKNEYLKIIKKTSAKVMMVIILLMMIGYPVILKFVHSKLSEEFASMYEELGSSDRYKQMASELSQDDPYYDLKLDLLNYMAEHKDAAAETSADGLDWHYALVLKASRSDDKQEIQRFSIMCRTNDWRGYLKNLLSDPKTDDISRWEYTYRLEHDIPLNSTSRESELIDEIVQLSGSVEYADEDVQKENQEAKLKKRKYMLENKIYFDTSESGSFEALAEKEVSFWDIYMMTPDIVPFFGYIMIVIAGGIIASEFSQGTIKFLLINPVKRWKILVAKYLTVISIGALLLLLLAVLSAPVIGLLFGFKNMNAPYLYVSGGEVHQMNSFFAVIKTYLLSSVDLIVMITLSFSLSSVARSSAMAVGFGLGMLTVGKTLAAVVNGFGFDWGKYIIFANTDLETIAAGRSPYPEHTLFFAVSVIAVYMFVFLLTAWDGFTKRSL